MNIWKLTSTNDVKILTAVVVALTPREASTLLIEQGGILISETLICKQLGTASTDRRIPEIVCVSSRSL